MLFLKIDYTVILPTMLLNNIVSYKSTNADPHSSEARSEVASIGVRPKPFGVRPQVWKQTISMKKGGFGKCQNSL